MSHPDPLELAAHLEPAAVAIQFPHAPKDSHDSMRAIVSAAVSLKRIADAMHDAEVTADAARFRWLMENDNFGLVAGYAGPSGRRDLDAICDNFMERQCAT